MLSWPSAVRRWVEAHTLSMRANDLDATPDKYSISGLKTQADKGVEFEALP